MRRMLSIIPILWKYMFISLLFFVTLCYLIYIFYMQVLVDIVSIQYLLGTFKKELIWFVLCLFLLCFLTFIALYFDIIYFLNRINYHIKYSIDRKKMIPNLEEYRSRDVCQDIIQNLNGMFSLFKNFDQMKSSRISLEITSIKTLINMIDEGVIFISQDKVVTHINHKAEDILRLAPGETLGESIARHVKNDDLLSHISTSLSNEQKITDMRVEIRKDEIISITILPVKNKFGELIRAVIILQA